MTTLEGRKGWGLWNFGKEVGLVDRQGAAGQHPTQDSCEGRMGGSKVGGARDTIRVIDCAQNTYEQVGHRAFFLLAKQLQGH